MLRSLVLAIALAAAAAIAWLTLQPASPVVTQSPSDNVIPASKSPLPVVLDHNGTPIPEETTAQAITHIDTITPPEAMPLNVRNAQHFVTADQILQLPIDQIQTSAGLETAQSATTATQPPTHPPEPTPASATDTRDVSDNLNLITIISGTSQQPPPVTLSSDQSTVTIRAVQGVGLTVTPLNSHSVSTTMPQPLPDSDLLLPNDGRQIKLKELLDHPEQAGNKIFYLHAVDQNDQQGLWGIIQNALVHSFAEGIELAGGKQAIQARIPDNADERLGDKRSSFLGHILQRKVKESYVYNYEKGALGRNPDLIRPGQQLVIITFTEEEMVQIYQFFTAPEDRT